MMDMKLVEAMETLINQVKKTKSNAEFLMQMGKNEF
jgi:transcription termination factor Rho